MPADCHHCGARFDATWRGADRQPTLLCISCYSAMARLLHRVPTEAEQRACADHLEPAAGSFDFLPGDRPGRRR